MQWHNICIVNRADADATAASDEIPRGFAEKNGSRRPGQKRESEEASNREKEKGNQREEKRRERRGDSVERRSSAAAFHFAEVAHFVRALESHRNDRA